MLSCLRSIENTNTRTHIITMNTATSSAPVSAAAGTSSSEGTLSSASVLSQSAQVNQPTTPTYAEVQAQLSEVEAQRARLAGVAAELKAQEEAKGRDTVKAALASLGIKDRASATALMGELFGGTVTVTPTNRTTGTAAKRKGGATSAGSKVAAPKGARRVGKTKGTGATSRKGRRFAPISEATKAAAVEDMKRGMTEGEAVAKYGFSPASFWILKRNAGLTGKGLGGRQRVTITGTPAQIAA